MAATDETDDFLTGKTQAAPTTVSAPADATDDFLSGKGAEPAKQAAAPETTWRGLARNAAAGLTDAGANVVNFLSDPAGNMLKIPSTLLAFAHDAVAPAMGPRFDDATRNWLLADSVPQPGTRAVSGIGNALSIEPGAVPADTDAERLMRKGVGGAATVGALGPGGIVAPAAGAVGAVTGDIAGQLAPEWAKPAAEMTGNIIGASAAAGVGAIGRSLTGSSGGAAPAIADLAQVARDKYGIPITAPQLSESSLVRAVNDQSSKLPFSGAEGNAAAQDAAWHAAVGKVMGEPGVTAFTPKVMAAAADRIGTGMDAIANRTHIDVNADPHLLNDLAAIEAEVHSGRVPLASGGEKSVDANIGSILDAAAHGKGTIAGDVYQKITQTNSALDRASNGGDVHTQDYNQQIMDALDRAFQRSAAPADQAKLGELRGQYRAMKTIEPLAAKSPDGTVNPADLMTRVTSQSRRFDGSTSGVAYTGGGDLGELARIGKQFMAKAPNSGTADRAMVNALAMGGFGGVGFAATGSPGALIGVPVGLAANRLAGAYLRSGLLSNRMINSSVSPGVNSLVSPTLLTPALAPPPGQQKIAPP